MVTPPTLKAAKPVGTVMAHVMSLDGHSPHTKALIVSISYLYPNTTNKHTKWFVITVAYTSFVLFLVDMVTLDIFKDTSLIDIYLRRDSTD